VRLFFILHLEKLSYCDSVNLVKMYSQSLKEPLFAELSIQIDGKNELIKKILEFLQRKDSYVRVYYTTWYQTSDDLVTPNREIGVLAFETRSTLDKKESVGKILLNTDILSLELLRKIEKFHDLAKKENAVMKTTYKIGEGNNQGWLTFEVACPKD